MAFVTEAGRGGNHRSAVNGIDTDARSYQKRFQSLKIGWRGGCS